MDITEEPPQVRVLMAAVRGESDPRAFFLVDLLDVEDWTHAGYRAVMYDVEDVMAYALWKTAHEGL